MENTNIKLITLLATFFVTLLSTVATPFSYFHLAWSVSVAYEAIGRMAYPLFLLIAGYMSLHEDESLIDTLKNRVVNLLIPLISWSIVYQLYDYFINGYNHSVSIFTLLSHPAYSHLWFIYTMILLYLITPMLNTFIQNGSRQRLNYILILWFTIASVYMLFNNIKESLLLGHSISHPSNIDLVVYFSGYYILGGVIHRFKITPKIPISALIFVLSTVLTAILTYSLSISTFAPNQIFLDYSAPTLVIVSVSFFFMLLRLKIKLSNTQEKIINTLSEYSMGIFFIHLLILQSLLRYLNINFEGQYSILTIPAMALLVYTLSTMIVTVIHLIPVLRKAV
ncbi:Surface polysaccharide O-acyltransferase, integral membrane enzyme [Izhakiella capsodis]|uniref:Surface polysaccharide O-acyltransferase, integral membrane enzyme n=1 Tax=Izhakiella capsodis TaxID=1367852 RepID=A0A1I4YKI2_9GAMM|nr:acyltransferase family protein [Izhakiella capsodis]SFN38090.1 Surface polysaccharide O-acyltransferase, integral membrane enzyme [Izhakiella capsodis]